MNRLLHLGEIIAMNAHLFPDKAGARDLTRSMTFRQWNERACRSPTPCSGWGSTRAIGSRSSPTTASSGWRSTRRWPKPAWSRCRSTSGWSAPRSATSSRTPKPPRSSSRTTCSTASRPSAPTCRSPRTRYIHFGAGKTPAGYRSYEDLIAGGRAQSSRRVEV